MKNTLFSILIVLVSMTFVTAQSSTGRLSGIVSSTDGVLAGATIVATDNSTQKELTVTSDDSGNFIFPQLEFGLYTVKVTAPGFKTFVAESVKIDVGRGYSLTPVLEVGQVQETVVVTAGADVVTSTTAQVSNTISPQQILSLPLITRDPLNLTTLQAGVQSNPFQNTVINGVRTSFTNITRDGINIQDAFIRTNATDFAPGRPSVDDTSEFTLVSSNQESDQGYGSAQIRLVTPRGGSDFHGALFAYNRNSKFAANNFFSNRSGQKIPFRNRNQFGGKIGGPLPVLGFGEGTPTIIKDKAFFFFAYEKVIDPLSGGANRTILTPSAAAGQFRYTRAALGPAINTQVNGANVNCPARVLATDPSVTCTISNILAFAAGSGLPNTTGVNGNPIPTTINPVILSRIISQLPKTSNASGGDGLNTAGYFLNRQSNSERSTYTTRIDLDINDKNSINGVYSYNFETNLRPDVDATGFNPIPTGSQTSANKTLSLTYRSVITSTIVNELRGGLFFSNVPFIRTVPIQDFFLSVPLVSNPENNFLNQGRNVKNYNIQDNVDVVLGKHSLKFGAQTQDFNVNAVNAVGTTPTFLITTSSATPTFATANFANAGGISTAQAGTANSLLALLGGFVAQGQQTFNLTDPTSGYQTAPNFQPFRYSNQSFYVSDRWQATSKLTLNGGVRYELFPALKLDTGLGLEPVITDPDNPIDSLLNRNGTYNVIGTNSGRERTYYKNDYNNFAPSVGFAYSPSFEKGVGKLLGKSLVIRGGFSRSYGNDQLVTGINNAATNNVGFAGRTGFAFGANGSNLLNGRLGSTVLPALTAPAFVTPPFSFIRNNTTGISATNNFGTVFAIDPKLQTPSVDQYSIGLQREFFGNTAFEIRYVGTRSRNLVRGVDFNQVDIFKNGFLNDFNRASANFALTGNAFCTTATNAGCQALTIFQSGGTGSAGRIPIGGVVPISTFNTLLQNGQPAELAFQIITLGANNHPNANAPNAVPFVNFVPNPATGAIDYLYNNANFNYNSLQLEVRRRFTSGLYFQVNYTFSKNLTNAIGSLNGPNSGQSLFEPYLDNNNQALDYSRADFDQTHTFNFNGVYQLPFGKGKTFLNNGGIVDKVFGGFELSGIVQRSSGAPITFVDSRGTLNRAGRSARQTPNSNLTSDQIRDLTGIFEANGNIYFINPSIINPANGQAANGYIGATGLNLNTTFNGQAFFNVAPGQTGNVGRFIIDGPSTLNVNTALLKNIRFTESVRVQLRAEAFNLFNNVNLFNNTQLANINSTTFGQITSAGAARTLQFAARFEF